MTELNRRIELHKPGQITWPEPDLKKYCTSCRHFGDISELKAGVKGRCGLVAKHHLKTTGIKFYGAEAIACPQFRDKDL